MKNFFRKSGSDWSKWMGEVPKSDKQKLIDYALKRKIAIYVDSPNENADGLASMFRGIVSEAELDKRIGEYKKLYWQKFTFFFLVASGLAGVFVWVGTKFKWF
jgi:hypothetical protein